jgi:hypothetical protein
MVAAERLLLVHVPPPPSVSVVVAPTHILLLPVMADGSGLTISGAVILHPVVASV